MGGKVSLILVLGFSITFLIAGLQYGSIATQTVENTVDYYTWTKVHNAAVSGANILANRVFTDPARINILDISPYTVTIDDIPIELSLETVDAGRNWRRAKARVISYIDPLSGKEYNENISMELVPASFARFAYFSNLESPVGTTTRIYWNTGEICNGPLHTNSQLSIMGTPIFNGPVTARLGRFEEKGADPTFNGGFSSGNQIDMPTNTMSRLESVANGTPGLLEPPTHECYIVFVPKVGGGTIVRYRFSTKDPYNEMDLTEFAPKRVIFAKNCKLFIEGTINGSVSIACSGSDKTEYGKQGNIYLTGSLKTSVNPNSTSPVCKDIIGVIAEQSIYIKDKDPADNTKSLNNKSIDIHASLYCQNGGFGSENWDDRGRDGKINLIGGIIQNARRTVGYTDGSSGFSKNYNYDARFATMSPPHFPGTGGFQMIAWGE